MNEKFVVDQIIYKILFVVMRIKISRSNIFIEFNGETITDLEELCDRSVYDHKWSVYKMQYSVS